MWQLTKNIIQQLGRKRPRLFPQLISPARETRANGDQRGALHCSPLDSPAPLSPLQAAEISYFKSKIQTETLIPSHDNIQQIGAALSTKIKKQFNRALSIRLVDAGSCNGCELEIQAINNPYYNIEQFGIHFVASPRHADMLLVTAPVSKNMRDALLKTYEAMPFPKLVIAIGNCAQCGGVFKDSYAILNTVNEVIPINYIIKGCPPTPIDIMSGILIALG